jgi:hypothetical protein
MRIEELAEPFTGTMSEIADFFLKKWCRSNNIDENKRTYLSHSLLNDLRVENTETGLKYKMWAGSSGCNFMMVDHTGGCHSFLQHDKNIYRVIIEEKHECKVCGEPFKTNEDLYHHYDENHNHNSN